MQIVLERLIMYVIGQLLTDDVTKKAKEVMIAHLRSLAARTDTAIDDAIVDIVADALNIK